MLPRIRTLLLAAAISGVMALLSPVAHATITITRAEVQWGDAVVMGRGADGKEEIFWLWRKDEVWQKDFVTEANKRGKFSFQGAVPSDCEGFVRAGENGEDVPVRLSNCTPTPPDSEESILDLVLVAKIEGEGAHEGEAVRAVGFIVDGVGETRVISGGEDATLRTWFLPNLENPENSEYPETLELQSFKSLDHTIYDFETSYDFETPADGSVVAIGEGGWNGGPGSDTLRIWTAADPLDPDTDPTADPAFNGTTAPIGFVYCVAISPYDPVLNRLWTVASGFYGDIVVYDTASLDLLATKKTKMKRTKALAFSPDGTILASTSTAGRIQLWSFPNKCDSESCLLERHPVSLSHGGSWVFPIAFAPYSTPHEIEIVSGSDGGMIKLWKFDLANPPDDPDFAVDSGAVYSLAYSPPDPVDSSSMIVAGGNGNITVYDALNLKILFQAVNAHAGRVNDVAFSPGGSFIVSGGADGALKLWDLSLGAE